jgi:hypothetical protein
VLSAYFDGQVCVTNTGAQATQNLVINDRLSKSTKVFNTVSVDVSAQPVINPGQTACYAYSIPLPANAINAGATYKDTAVVTITNKSGSFGTPAGTSASASAALPTTPTLVNAAISVSDTNGQTFNFSASGSQQYSQNVACTAPSMTITNTATIVGTQQSVQASAQITCTARTISGTGATNYITTTANTMIVIDYSSVPIEALVPDGSGGLTSFPGTGTPSGTFSIPSVPFGLYTLHVGSNYVVTTSSTPDLSTFAEGRSDVQPIDPSQLSSTIINVGLGSLAPWQTGDMLEFFAPNANDYVFGLDQLATSGTPQAGDTSLNLSFDATAFVFGGVGANLIDANKGDITYLTQLSQQFSDCGQLSGCSSIPYIGLNRAYQTSLFTLAANTTNTFSTFTPPNGPGDSFTDLSSGSSSISLEMKTTQFAALLSGFNPGAANCASVTTVDQEPFCFANIGISDIPNAPTGSPYGFYGATADLLILQLPPGGPDVMTGSMSYGDPFLAGILARLFTVQYGSLVPAIAPGATRPTFFSNEILWVTDVSTAAAGPIVPSLSAPQSIAVVPTGGGASANFYSDQTGVGSSPTISWSSPAIGTPTLYQLNIYQLTNVNGGTRRHLVASLFTSNTSVTLPNLLTAGNASVIVLVAESGPSVGAPLKTTDPESEVLVSSGVLQP